ncbi:MAG: NnrU family protein [Pseudanabaenaceae cyanobacterium SKYGB_i_bin29]|nr:NnrU family protein [Pseudanabaenaceae cyanobacterium SKYG29]MDW8422114.1 NnrU family protein [Pseudanabaenaceae cyanobacterium SKYGB_i_bin29]
MSHLVVLGLLLLFATAHSGLASLRLRLEDKIGARLYRLIFALVSITLAVPLFVYYFNHRYDGLVLWSLQNVAGVHELVWILSAIAFFFLYPATFNLLEIAAIAKPQVHLYETGIIRIARHPQLVGMTLWCIAHTLWLGTSFAVVTAIGLIAYHLFGAWHGDRRLLARYGESFRSVQARTSIVPFLAIYRGKQKIVWQEFLRPAYLGIVLTIAVFYWLHPLVIAASANLAY